MDTATKNLENDHVHILRLIDVMEKMTLSSDVSLTHLETVVSLIRNYADGFHHAKEEKLFFPQLIKKGFSPEHGPIAVMLNEHTEGRCYVKSMADEIANYKKGNKAALPKIFENMQGYIELLRNHISKENDVLFRMADHAFSESEQQELLVKFSEIERTDYSDGALNEFISTIDKLDSQFKD
jgi:hemerythrin-like domain-containing protein